MQMCPECSCDNLDSAVTCSRCGAQLRGLHGSMTVLNNRYRLIKVLGCGGMGAVYLAEDLRLYGRNVAVKENFDTSSEGQKQFEVETKILATLSHPNLPRVIDYFVSGGKQYVVMDYIPGEDLQSIIERNGPQKLDEALKWFWQVCDAVEYLHSQSPPVIHRDIKPGNIKIQHDGKAFLVDFGIAKFYRPGQKTVAGAQAVTPGFSPIEQYGKGITDQRSDIYSLAATLYFALTGIAPPDAVERLTHNKRLVSIASVNKSVPAHVESVIEKALRIRPTERYNSVRDFRDAIKTAIAQPSYTPHRIPPTYGRHRMGQQPRQQPTMTPDLLGCFMQLFELLFWMLIAWSFGCCLMVLVAYVLTGAGFGYFIATGNPIPLLTFLFVLITLMQAMRLAHRRHRQKP